MLQYRLKKRHFVEYLDGENGQITSLGYPCEYPNNVNYTWIIKMETTKPA